MEVLSNTEMLPVLCKLKKKFGMYISFCEDQGWSETKKAAPYLGFSVNHQVFVDGHAWLLFDNEKEMLDCYDKTVCNGPTKLNSYKGSGSVYALTCSSTGELLNENT